PMARRNRAQIRANAAARLRVAESAANGPKEGRPRVENDKEGKGKARWSAENLAQLRDHLLQPRWDEHLVRLNTGAGEWPLLEAECAFMDLQDLQNDRPAEFEALVAIVKPRGATKSPPDAPPHVLAWLTEAEMVLPDGSVDPLIAALLDGAYK